MLLNFRHWFVRSFTTSSKSNNRLNRSCDVFSISFLTGIQCLAVFSWDFETRSDGMFWLCIVIYHAFSTAYALMLFWGVTLRFGTDRERFFLSSLSYVPYPLVFSLHSLFRGYRFVLLNAAVLGLPHFLYVNSWNLLF